MVGDRSLYSTAVFILAARADLPSEELRRRFPAQLKIGPVEKINNLVNLQLPGVPVHAVPVAPRQIPYHAGFAYFELDQSGDLWEQLKASGGIGMHVAGEFPGLALEFWAIRS
jgi:type VI secretion system protein ImpJ